MISSQKSNNIRCEIKMEKELIELFETAKKAADASAESDSSPEEDRCIDALKQLEKFPVNSQILVSTQVGKHLRQITKHPRKKIQALASNLIATWKHIVCEEVAKNKKNTNLNDTNSIKSGKIERLSSTKVDKVSRMEKTDHSSTKTTKVETHKAEKTVKTEKYTKTVAPPKLASVIYCKDPLRDKIRELISEALLKVYNEIDEELKAEAEACDPYRCAVSLESVMFDKWGKSNGTHKFKYRSVMFNIKDANNPDFRRKVILGHVKPERVVEMSPEEMASNERQMQNGKIKEKALFDCERGGAQKATTDQFKCGRCGKRQCTYYQMQTRSADEPMTTFVTCVNCDNHWKFC